MTVLTHFASRCRQRWFAAHGVNFALGSHLARGVSMTRGFRGGRNGIITLGPRCELHEGVCLHAWGGAINVGENVFIGPYAVVYGHGGVTIGAHTLISMHCRILSSNHALPPPGTPIRFQPDTLLPTQIGQDVWLGAGVTVLGGVTISDGCVVGAGAIVTEDLPPNAIALGVPARVIRLRS